MRMSHRCGSEASRCESGNVMFFILIAIVLLAALSFAITQGGRDSSNNMSTERQRLLGTEIIDYGDVLQKSVQILRSRGIAFTSLGFAAPGLPAAYGIAGAAPTAEIFNDAGAGALYKRADDQSFTGAAQDYIFTARNEIAQVGTTCGGDDCADLLVLLPGLARAVCIDINRQLGIGTEGDGTAARFHFRCHALRRRRRLQPDDRRCRRRRQERGLRRQLGRRFERQLCILSGAVAALTPALIQARLPRPAAK